MTVVTFTTRIRPSAPGSTRVTRPTGQRPRGTFPLATYEQADTDLGRVFGPRGHRGERIVVTVVARRDPAAQLAAPTAGLVVAQTSRINTNASARVPIGVCRRRAQIVSGGHRRRRAS